jgi:hypothetical protein
MYAFEEWGKLQKTFWIKSPEIKPLTPIEINIHSTNGLGIKGIITNPRIVGSNNGAREAYIKVRLG